VERGGIRGERVRNKQEGRKETSLDLAGSVSNKRALPVLVLQATFCLEMVR